jgi:Na+/proline symporter
MILTVGFIVIKGTIDVGGLGELYSINKQGGRLNLFDFNPDPFERQTFWSLYFGGCVYFSFAYCFDQQMIQRFRASKSIRQAQTALLFNIPFIFIFMFFCCLIGLVIYATYAECDPFKSGQIKNINHYSSFFVLERLSGLHGVAGLFLGAVFCSSLSTLSSCLHCLSLVIWKDILCKFSYFTSFNERKKLNTNRCLVLFCGFLSTLVCYLISMTTLNLTQLNNMLNSVFNGPLIGLFISSMFFSITNKYGAISGLIFGLSSIWTISLGAFILKPSYSTLNVSIESCHENSSSLIAQMNQTSFKKLNLEGFERIFSLSYMWYTTFGSFVTIFTSLLISILSGGLRNDVNKKFIVFDLSKFCKLNKK